MEVEEKKEEESMRRGGAGEEEEWVSKRRTRRRTKGWASSKRRRRSSNSRKSGSGGREACGWREGRRREIQISKFEIVAPSFDELQSEKWWAHLWANCGLNPHGLGG